MGSKSSKLRKKIIGNTFGKRSVDPQPFMFMGDILTTPETCSSIDGTWSDADKACTMSDSLTPEFCSFVFGSPKEFPNAPQGTHILVPRELCKIVSHGGTWDDGKQVCTVAGLQPGTCRRGFGTWVGVESASGDCELGTAGLSKLCSSMGDSDLHVRCKGRFGGEWKKRRCEVRDGLEGRYGALSASDSSNNDIATGAVIMSGAFLLAIILVLGLGYLRQLAIDKRRERPSVEGQVVIDRGDHYVVRGEAFLV